MILDRNSAIAGARSTVDGRRDSGKATQTSAGLVARKNVATTLKTKTSLTASTLLTAESSAGQSGIASTPIPTTSTRATSSSSSSADDTLTNGIIAVIIVVVVFVFALAVASRVYYNWRRRAVQKRTSSTFIQYAFYTDASPRRVSVVPRGDQVDALTPPIKPPEWDARSAAASSTAATFDSPISASERNFGSRVHVQSIDEKLRDIFYPEQVRPNPTLPSFVPSFSSPISTNSTTMATTPISPPPRAAHTHPLTGLPSFVPEPTTSPQAWKNPPPNPLALALYPDHLRTPAAQSTFLSPWSLAGSGERGVTPRTPVYGSEVVEIRLDGRPPSYGRH